MRTFRLYKRCRRLSVLRKVAQLHWMVGRVDVIVKGRNVHRYGRFDLLGRHHHAVSKRLSPVTQGWGAIFHENEKLLKLLKRKENVTQDGQNNTLYLQGSLVLEKGIWWSIILVHLWKQLKFMLSKSLPFYYANPAIIFCYAHTINIDLLPEITYTINKISKNVCCITPNLKSEN